MRVVVLKEIDIGERFRLIDTPDAPVYRRVHHLDHITSFIQASIRPWDKESPTRCLDLNTIVHPTKPALHIPIPAPEAREEVSC